jgi:hypothetical protein
MSTPSPCISTESMGESRMRDSKSEMSVLLGMVSSCFYGARLSACTPKEILLLSSSFIYESMLRLVSINVEWYLATVLIP